MIRRLALLNFKCLESLDLVCAPLTVLCGVNGTGKSSVIQSLLVLRQSFQAGELNRGRLMLGGDLADLGTGQDVMFEQAEEERVAFELQSTEVVEPCRLSFEYSRTADELRADQAALATASRISEAWSAVPPLGGNLVYVTAERIGPRKLYGQSEVRARQGDLGSRGEYSLNFFLARQRDTVLDDDARRGGATSLRLTDVLEYWLQQITPGAHLQMTTVQEADAVIAGFSFDRPDDVPSRSYRATNVGFGISYTLPVLAALLAPRGTLCLIENPEAHLHPRGQTKLGELAVRAGLSGVQVIVETHSDHFMDGVRIAVRDRLAEPSSIAIHYFERRGITATVSSPRLDTDGRLSSWPEGFFDQHEKNLAKLLAPRR